MLAVAGFGLSVFNAWQAQVERVRDRAEDERLLAAETAAAVARGWRALGGETGLTSALRVPPQRLAAAEREARLALRDRPGDAAALALQGFVDLAHGRAPRAGESFESALARDPRHLPALVGSGLAAEALGDLAAAARAFERARAVASAPGSRTGRRARAHVLVHLGRVHLAAEDPARAQRSLDGALRLAPDDPAVLAHLGNLYARQGNYPAAVRVYRRVLTLRPDDAGLATSLASAQYLGGDTAGAEASLRRAVAAEPGDAESRRFLALLLERTGRGGEAEALRRPAAPAGAQSAG